MAFAGSISSCLCESKPDLARSKLDPAQRKPDLAQSKPDLAQSKLDLAQRKLDLAQSKPGLAKSKPDLAQSKSDHESSSSELLGSGLERRSEFVLDGDMQSAARKLPAAFEACDKFTARGDGEDMHLPAVLQFFELKMTRNLNWGVCDLQCRDGDLGNTATVFDLLWRALGATGQRNLSVRKDADGQLLALIFKSDQARLDLGHIDLSVKVTALYEIAKLAKGHSGSVSIAKYVHAWFATAQEHTSNFRCRSLGELPAAKSLLLPLRDNKLEKSSSDTSLQLRKIRKDTPTTAKILQGANEFGRLPKELKNPTTEAEIAEYKLAKKIRKSALKDRVQKLFETPKESENTLRRFTPCGVLHPATTDSGGLHLAASSSVVQQASEPPAKKARVASCTALASNANSSHAHLAAEKAGAATASSGSGGAYPAGSTGDSADV